MAEVTYTVPESARSQDTDPSSLTFTVLSMAQELDAMKEAEVKGGGGLKFTYECVRRSVVKVNGKPVTWTDGIGPDWMEKASQKVLTLASRAYSKLNTPSEQESADFLKSEVRAA